MAGAADSGSGAWWAAEDLQVLVSKRVASLRIDLRVARTTGLSYSGMWSSLPGGTSMTHIDSSTAVDYVFSIAPSGGLAAGTYTLSGAFGLTGILHTMGADSWTATTTGPASTSAATL